MLELADACRRVSGVDLEPEFARRRGSASSSEASSTSRLAGRELGWRPQTDLDAGLAATWDSIRAEGTTGGAAN